MTESPAQGSETWTRDERLGGLYVLHANGSRCADTALVDRAKTRSDQVNELARLEWPPPQQMTAVYEATVQARMPKPTHLTLPEGRHVCPLLGGLGAVMDGDGEASEHVVRRYLYPDLNADGSLALDPDERLVWKWKSGSPKVYMVQGDDQLASSLVPGGGPRMGWTHCADDGGVGSSPTQVPGNLIDWTGRLTTTRLIYTARISVPAAVRQDYSLKLAMVSPALDEVRATFRQVKRWQQRPNLYWGFHVRHEWVNHFGFAHYPDRKKPLFGPLSPSDVIIAGFRLPLRRAVRFHVPYHVGEPSSERVVADYRDAILADRPQVVVTGPNQHARQTTTPGVGLKKETEQATVWEVEGTVPYSLPATF